MPADRSCGQRRTHDAGSGQISTTRVSHGFPDHGVGQQPPAQRQAPSGHRRRPPAPGASKVVTRARLRAGHRGHDPLRQPHLQQIRSMPRSAADSTSRASAGDAPAASRSAYAAGCSHVPPPRPRRRGCAPRPDPPPVAAAPVAEVVPAAGLLADAPSWTPRTPVAGIGQQLVGQQVLVGQSSSSGAAISPRRTAGRQLACRPRRSARTRGRGPAPPPAPPPAVRQSASDSPGVP